ncbi:MAG: gamma-glutamylcyclotransferase [Hylemonella sp.]
MNPSRSASVVSPRNPAAMLADTLTHWGGREDLWIFGYASLIWRPDFEFDERRPARVQGWHRALRMWSRINRGTPQCPGLVFALLSGGSCHGVAFRIRRHRVDAVLAGLWEREMPSAVYDPRWLRCETAQGTLNALAFTLSRQSPSYTGELSQQQYLQIFAQAVGRYGSTHEYAHQTYQSLRAHGIRDKKLELILGLKQNTLG